MKFSSDREREFAEIERRADAVAATLAGRGIAPDRLTTVGFGESQPAAPNDTAEGKAQNRRVVFTRVQG